MSILGAGIGGHLPVPSHCLAHADSSCCRGSVLPILRTRLPLWFSIVRSPQHLIPLTTRTAVRIMSSWPKTRLPPPIPADNISRHSGGGRNPPAPGALSQHRCGTTAFPPHSCGKGVANSSDGPEPPAMNPTTMQQFSTLSADKRRRARGLSPLPLRPHTRSDTAEVGPGPLFHSVPFSPVHVLDLARSYTGKSRRAP